MPGQTARENGKRGGRPRGRQNNLTITKAEAREALRVIVQQHMAEMTAAQIANAMGIKYLVVREKGSGKFVRVTEAMAKAKLGKTEEIIEVWEKEPSTPAFTDLMNRALDKPKEQEQEIKLTSAISDMTDEELKARALKLLGGVRG